MVCITVERRCVLRHGQTGSCVALAPLMARSPVRLKRKAILAIEIALVAALVGVMYLGTISTLAGIVSEAWHWITR